MGDTVFANGRAISCKASNGKSICAFPDVCLSPPTPPAGPLPIPYPNTVMASDMASGSTTVKIEKKPVILKDSSYFSTSTGDEAGTQGGGVVTHKTKGKAYFSMWSMDVKADGENVCRHLDVTMHNAASFPRNTATWPYLSEAQAKKGGPCDGVNAKFMLTPYSDGCDDKKTPHHVIPNRQFTGSEDYTRGSAPCICVTGRNQHGDTEHGKCHAIVDLAEYQAHTDPNADYPYKDARDNAADACRGANNGQMSAKALKCLKAQLDNYYKKRCGVDDDDPVKTSGAPGKNLSSLVEEDGT